MGERELWSFMWVFPPVQSGLWRTAGCPCSSGGVFSSGEIFILKPLRELEGGNYEQWWWDGQWGLFWLG